MTHLIDCPLILIRRTLISLCLIGFATVLAAAPNPALEDLATKGDPAAQLALAMRYLEGRDGVEADLAASVKWATLSAEQGHGPACEMLGQYFISDENRQRDTSKAARYLQKALASNPDSMTAKGALGLLYHQGSGVPLDPDKGLQLIQESAAANDPVGLALAAELKKRGHLNGILPRETPRATLLKRAEDGDASAQYDLSVAYSKGWIETPPGTNPARMWRDRAAESGSTAAQFEIGQGYRTGSSGYTKDLTRAELWLKRSADGDHGPAQAALGLMYLKGEGLAQDDKLAADYLRKAVASGQKQVEAPYAILLAQGRGTLANADEAIRLFRGAELRGDETARTFLSREFMADEYGPDNAEEMVRLLRHAIKQGNNRAREVLGIRLYTGDQVKQDVQEALPLLEQAAERGSALAVRALFDHISKSMAKFGSNSSIHQIIRQDLYQLHRKMTVLYGVNGESADRVIAAKALTEFKPLNPPPKQTGARGDTLLWLPPTGTLEAMALLQIYRSEGGTDREALKWLTEAEKQMTNPKELDLLVEEYTAKIAQRKK